MRVPTLVTLTLVLLAQCAQAATIQTIAGTGQTTDGGSGGPALQTNIGNPFGVEVGPDGALYITEVSNHRVRRLDLKTGQLTTVAGNGQKGYSGDGGPATEASLNEPYEVRFDAQGNMYFVEMQNHLVRKVDRQGADLDRRRHRQARLWRRRRPGAGRPVPQSAQHRAGRPRRAVRGRYRQPSHPPDRSGQGDRSNRSPATATSSSPRTASRSRIVRSSARGPCSSAAARCGSPCAKATASGSWTSIPALLKHVAGNGQKGFTGDGGPAGQATFNGPKGIALDAQSKGVYVVDTENQAIRRIDLGDGKITTIAGSGPQARGYGGDDGPATQAKMNRPHGICLGPDGTVYIGDSENHRVPQCA